MNFLCFGSLTKFTNFTDELYSDFPCVRSLTRSPNFLIDDFFSCWWLVCFYRHFLSRVIVWFVEIGDSPFIVVCMLEKCPSRRKMRSNKKKMALQNPSTFPRAVPFLPFFQILLMAWIYRILLYLNSCSSLDYYSQISPWDESVELSFYVLSSSIYGTSWWDMHRVSLFTEFVHDR